MSTMTAETILRLIEQLPPTEQARLEQLIVQRQAKPQNGKPPLIPKPWPTAG